MLFHDFLWADFLTSLERLDTTLAAALHCHCLCCSHTAVFFPMFGWVTRGDIMKIVPPHERVSHSCFSLFASLKRHKVSKPPYLIPSWFLSKTLSLYYITLHMRLQQIVWEDGNSKSPWRINIAVRWKSCYSNFHVFTLNEGLHGLLWVEKMIMKPLFIYVTSFQSGTVINQKRLFLNSVKDVSFLAWKKRSRREILQRCRSRWNRRDIMQIVSAL